MIHQLHLLVIDVVILKHQVYRVDTVHVGLAVETEIVLQQGTLFRRGVWRLR